MSSTQVWSDLVPYDPIWSDYIVLYYISYIILYYLPYYILYIILCIISFRVPIIPIIPIIPIVPIVLIVPIAPIVRSALRKLQCPGAGCVGEQALVELQKAEETVSTRPIRPKRDKDRITGTLNDNRDPI